MVLASGATSSPVVADPSRFPGKPGLLEVFGDGPLLVALLGAPGSGKTTWRRRWLPVVPAVNLDENRALLSPFRCESDQAVTAAALHMAYTQAGAVLASGRQVLWDATSTDRASRMALQVLAAEHGATTAAFVLLPPLEVCLERNGRRDATLCPCGFPRRVPEEFVVGSYADLAAVLPSLPSEGWDVVAFADQLVHETPAGTSTPVQHLGGGR
ncbi:AAA family ATPase [Amycolatopsis sp. cg9]|uniref:AAA family ATPase n=1 Tax=Amycolatopsis sp. cg9 TaxID=3238801 RepID=UPI0035254FAD